MNRPIRVLIADNNQQFLQQLTSFLAQQEGLTVVHTTRDGQGTVTACQETRPDLVVIDLHLPVLDSVRAIKQIKTQNEQIKILGMSELANDRYAIEAVKAGANGFVKKNGPNSYQDIAWAIEQVAQGEVVLDSTLALNILEEFS